MQFGIFGISSFNAVVQVGPELEVRREGFEVSELRVAELEDGRRFGECSSKKTIGSRNPVLLATKPGSCAISTGFLCQGCEFDGVWYRCSPLQLPIRTHRNRSDEFVESQQKSPFRSGGMSLLAFGTKAKYRYLWSTGVRIPTATLVKADAIRAPELSSVYSKQIG